MSDFDPNLICPLCGERTVKHDGKNYVSREHLPPKSIFVEGTSDLITVPSCEECNAGTSKLDEKFKVSMGIYLGHKMPAFWQKALQTLNHNRGYKKKILDAISPILTPFGNGEWRHRMAIDEKPINTAITKICRGLHWHITKEVLPADAKVSINFMRQDSNLHPEVKTVLNKHGKWLQTGNGTFQAQYGIAVDQEYASLWLFKFYNEDCFLVSILPAHRQKNEQPQ